MNQQLNKNIMNFEKFAGCFVQELRNCLNEVQIDQVKKAVEMIKEAYRQDKQIFFVGNGGSASTASHFATDLTKGVAIEGKRRFRALSLTDNVAMISAIGNDIGFGEVFSEQLKPFVKRGDLVIVISASGNSPNVVNAVKFSKSKGALVLGIVGFGGGTVQSIADRSIILNSQHYGHVETVHLFLEHLIVHYFMEFLKFDES